MVDIEKLALIQLLGTNTKRRYAFIGGGGCFRKFLRKKSWPSHFPEWINA